METTQPLQLPGRGFNRRTFLLGIGSLVLGTFIGGCTEDTDPISPTATSIPTLTPTPSAEQQLFNIAVEVTGLMNVQNEQQVWKNTVLIMPPMYKAYCIAFPGCVASTAPQVTPLGLEAYTDAMQAQDPLNLRPDSSYVQTILATTLPDGTVIINKDEQRVRQTLDVGRYENVISQMPAVFLEEIFHYDRSPMNLDTDYTIAGYSFDRINGFAFENTETGDKFTYIEEAASVLASLAVQEELGVPPNLVSESYRSVADYLWYRMQTVGMSSERMVSLHRSSDLDTLLQELYPEITDVNERRTTATYEFNSIINQ